MPHCRQLVCLSRARQLALVTWFFIGQLNWPSWRWPIRKLLFWAFGVILCRGINKKQNMADLEEPMELDPTPGSSKSGDKTEGKSSHVPTKKSDETTSSYELPWWVTLHFITVLSLACRIWHWNPCDMGSCALNDLFVISEVNDPLSTK